MKCLLSEIRHFRKSVLARYARWRPVVAPSYSSATICRLCRPFVIEEYFFVQVHCSILVVRKKRSTCTCPVFPRRTVRMIIQIADLALATIVTRWRVPFEKSLGGRRKKLLIL